MRIVDEIQHPRYKITIFLHEERFTIKFEDKFLEQSYKVRQGGIINDYHDIKKLITPSFLSKVSDIFDNMGLSFIDSQKSFKSDQNFKFDEII